jgi:hypothetical protein
MCISEKGEMPNIPLAYIIRKQGDLISLLSFVFQNKEIGLMKIALIIM